ncbi:MAG: alpha/beta hydrolase [Bacteroidia bacterium]|nr:alpha/beta hydrolase [Bacteroidia bacterium]MCF8426783.1 alpha/beta hydrolase [Bacteroidia bacterium]MCF8445575.1 alpha/beta hydrolase [Bacteroidia bacterium]
MDYNIRKEGKFNYIDEGSGEVLVLLHGLFGALSNWKDVLNHFSKNHRVVIPLMPIFEMNILKLSVEGLANYIHDFIEYKEFQKVHLLGNSLGGHVALVYIKKYPQKVETLLLTGSSGLYENAFGASYPRKGDKQYLKDRVSLTFYDPSSTTDELVDEVYETIQDKGKLLRILTMAKSAIRHNMRKDLPNFKMPVCLIWGKQDTITPPDVCDEFDDLLPNSEKHFIDKCGHAPMMEQPIEFNLLADQFYKKHISY